MAEPQRKKWRLTPQGRLFIMVIFLVLVSAYLLNHSLLFLLAALFSGTFIYNGLLLKFAFPHFHLDWNAPKQLFAGAKAHLPLSIKNANRIFPLRNLEILLRGPGVLTHPLILSDVKPGQTHQTELELNPSARGRLVLNDAVVRCGYPFGFIECRQVQPVKLSLLVFPAMLATTPTDLFGTRPRRGTIPRNSQDFQYLAKYHDGDDVRLIHWRKSTLLESPVIRKDLTQMDAIKPQVLVADPCPTFEQGVSALATMAVTTQAWSPWFIWTAKGIQSLPDQHALLVALATIRPLTQDQIATATASEDQNKIIRISQIAATLAAPVP